MASDRSYICKGSQLSFFGFVVLVKGTRGYSGCHWGLMQEEGSPEHSQFSECVTEVRNCYALCCTGRHWMEMWTEGIFKAGIWWLLCFLWLLNWAWLVRGGPAPSPARTMYGCCQFIRAQQIVVWNPLLLYPTSSRETHIAQEGVHNKVVLKCVCYTPKLEEKEYAVKGIDLFLKERKPA